MCDVVVVVRSLWFRACFFLFFFLLSLLIDIRCFFWVVVDVVVGRCLWFLVVVPFW